MGYHDSHTPIYIRDSWRTPKQVFDYLNDEFGFVLDVAASDENHLCDDYYTIDDDSLNQPWDRGGYVWCNPPYSNSRNFVEKAIEEKCGTVMLLPADTSTKWFQECVDSCDEIRFIIGGRLSFIHPESGKPMGGGKAGSLLMIWYPESDMKQDCVFTYVTRDEIMGK